MVHKIPQNLQEVEQLCQQITDKSLGHLAEDLMQKVPTNLLHSKGWQGQLIENYFGVHTNNQNQPDLAHLNIEIKTIPLSTRYQPLESTYVCTVQSNQASIQWHDSWVYNKLRCVLWVPIIAARDIPIAERIVKTPFIWQMDSATEDILRTDWEELMEMIQFGNAKKITANYGTYLHIRPKAANSSVTLDYVAADGNNCKLNPQGFYLRSSFTQHILQEFSAKIS